MTIGNLFFDRDGFIVLKTNTNFVGSYKMKKLIVIMMLVCCFNLQAQMGGSPGPGGDEFSDTGAVRPNQPANRILRSVVKYKVRDKDESASSAGFFEDLSLDYAYVFTDFDDDLV